MIEKKKICFVIPSLQAGGMERVMSEIAGYFSRKKEVELHLILYGNTRELFHSIPESVIIHKPFFTFNNKWRLFYTFKTLMYLRSIIKKINPKSILSFGEYWNSFVLLAFYGLSYPVFISDRCSPAKEFSYFHRILRSYIYPSAKGIIAQTLQAKQIYKGQFRHDNVTVIGNPIPQIRFSDIQKENIVLTVGRLIRSKNHDKLIEVFCKINKPDWKLVIVGGDALKQDNLTRLRKLIYDLHAESKIFITGYVNNSEELMQKSKVFAFTSTSEGFPNVIGEAMAAGLPVVAFDCVTGPSEMIINENNGYLVPVNDYDTFCEKLDQLMSDESLRILFGLRARISIKEFSAEKIGGKFYDFILNT